MNALNLNLSKNRTVLAWLCALAPAVFLFVFFTMAAHIRLSFGHWPDQSVGGFREPLEVHNWIIAGSLLFNFVAFIHLIVTLIHHREFSAGFGRAVLHVSLFIAGWVLLFVFLANAPARFVVWFID